MTNKSENKEIPSPGEFIQARMTKGLIELYDHEIMFATEALVEFAQLHVEMYGINTDQLKEFVQKVLGNKYRK
jgi:hypothetical protein